MPRRLKLCPVELGDIELQLVYSYGGEWEPEWRALQGSLIAGLFTHVSKAVMDHALQGWTSPLVKALGLSPEGALHKLPKVMRQCWSRPNCPHSGTYCTPLDKKMPWCFTPDGIEDEEMRQLAHEAIRLWREKVYIIVVTEDEHAR